MTKFHDIPDFDDLPDHVKEHVIKTRQQSSHSPVEHPKKDEPVVEVVETAAAKARKKIAENNEKKEE